MTADRTEVDHNKWYIDDQNKETKTRTADGGSVDGCWERGNVGTIGNEPDTGNNEDKVGRVDAKMKVTKRTDNKQDRDKTEGKMMADGTEVDNNKWDINDLNKETKTLSVEGGSEDGCRERGYEGTINGEPYTYIDEDNDRVWKMITKIQEVGDAMTSDNRRKAIAEIQGDGGEGNLPYSQHLRGNRYEAEDAEHDRVHEDEGTGQGTRYKDGGAGRRRRNKAKEEQKETSSESSDIEGEQEVNQVIRNQVWPGTRATARKRNVRRKAVKDNKDEDEESYPGGSRRFTRSPGTMPGQGQGRRPRRGTSDTLRWRAVRTRPRARGATGGSRPRARGAVGSTRARARGVMRPR